jgi:hypothetical protein
VYVLIEVWSGPWPTLEVGGSGPKVPHFAGVGVESQRQPFGLVLIVVTD